MEILDDGLVYDFKLAVGQRFEFEGYSYEIVKIGTRFQRMPKGFNYTNGGYDRPSVWYRMTYPNGRTVRCVSWIEKDGLFNNEIFIASYGSIGYMNLVK